MKTLYHSTLFLLISITIFSQRQTTTLPGYIGLNTTNPTSFLTIEGNEQATVSSPDTRFFLKLNNKSNHTSSVVVMELTSGTNSGKTLLGHHAPTYYFPGLDEYSDFGQLYSTGAGLILRSGSSTNPNGVIKFMTGITSPGGSTERMRIVSNGNVGIGTQAPKAKLQVTDGDVYIQNPNRGIILTSPNGSCWRVIVDDFGNLVRLNITCPN